MNHNHVLICPPLSRRKMVEEYDEELGIRNRNWELGIANKEIAKISD
uniref:Uncharacterized protein n=1 Tax=Rhizophora mucronata TaxID=61149 RepID=A0A2P2NYH8_RHIMU